MIVGVSTSDPVGYADLDFGVVRLKSGTPAGGVMNPRPVPTHYAESPCLQVVTDDRDDGAQARPETRDPVPRRGQPDPVAVAVPAAAQAMSALPDGTVVHTIPVPAGWSPEQAWEAINRGDRLDDPEPAWANVLVRDGRFVEVLR